MEKRDTNAPAGNRTRVCTVAGYYSTTRPLVLVDTRPLTLIDVLHLKCRQSQAWLQKSGIENIQNGSHAIGFLITNSKFVTPKSLKLEISTFHANATQQGIRSTHNEKDILIFSTTQSSRPNLHNVHVNWISS